MDEISLEEEIKKQVSEEPATNSDEFVAQKHEVLTTLSETAKLKLEAIEDLMAPCDRATYGEKLRKWAEKLDKSVRTVQRLIKKWEKRGSLAVIDDSRDDKGFFRKAKYRDSVSGEEREFDWAAYVVATYRTGNQGSQKTSRSQIMIRVRAKAEEVGIKPISHMTVYRILNAALAGEKDKQKVLRTATLSNANLAEANLRNSMLNDAILTDADLTGADLSNADMTGATLNGAILSRVILQGANLSNGSLSGVNLRGLNLRGLKLQGADLKDANLSGLNLSKLNLSGAKLNDANLSGSNLSGADLSSANLSGANLQGANLREATLKKADLRNAKLQGANLRDAILDEATLGEAVLK